MRGSARENFIPTAPHSAPPPTTRDVSRRSEVQVSGFPSRKWDIGEASETELQVSGFPSRKLRRSPFEDAYQKFDTKEDSWRRTLDRRDITADKANIFNRGGGVLTQFQLFDNYELSTSELVPQIHPQMKLQWSNIFSTHCWNHNVIWTYNLVVSVEQALSTEDVGS